MRIGILGLLQESNTFQPVKTGVEHFHADVFARGSEVVNQFADAPHEIGGFLSGVARAGASAVPLFAARALPYGMIEANAFEHIVATMLHELHNSGPIDGLLVAPHGATVSESFPDADGHWLSMVRQSVGPAVPIVGTIDPHANLTEQMVNVCDALIAYRTNPHLDQRERGEEAAALLIRTLRNQIRPRMSATFPPMAMSIDRQCTEEAPCRELCGLADEMRHGPNVLSASIVLGFPYADVPEMGSSAIVVADGDSTEAQRLAGQLGVAMWRKRHDFVGRLNSIYEAVEQAHRAEAPVCLLDMGDNVGGGAPADGTWLARALIDRQVRDSLVVICDEAAVHAAATTGIGTKARFTVGGRSGASSGDPLDEGFTVVYLCDGKSSEARATHGGFTSFDHGMTAVLTVDAGPTIVVTSRRMVPFSLAQLRSCGLDPSAFRILVAKGVNAPIAAYREVCRTFIRVDTPGITSADMTRLSYRRRRRPMFPFEPDCDWHG